MPAQVTNIQSDALFILLVEKDAAFMRLAEDRFYNDYPSIIITAKGQPDVATRCVLLAAAAARWCSTAGTSPALLAMQLQQETNRLRRASPVSVRCAAARLFLRKLKLTLKIPVLALVDSDPYGLKILSVYMKGVRRPPAAALARTEVLRHTQC